jgi:hypothetical protein
VQKIKGKRNFFCVKGGVKAPDDGQWATNGWLQQPSDERSHAGRRATPGPIRLAPIFEFSLFFIIFF